MKRILILILPILLTASLAVQTPALNNKNKMAQPVHKSKGTVLQRRVPEGVVVSRNRVVVKTGYKLVKQSDGTVVSMRVKKDPVITGRFQCSCTRRKDPKKSGSCEFGTLGGNSATCFAAEGCDECRLETIVTSTGKAPANHRRRP
jgi:hypothetical protein